MKNLKVVAISYAVLVLAGSAFAQEVKDVPFPDTPENHWAFESIQHLKDSLVFKYPEGLINRKPVTRDEMANSICQLWEVLQGKERACYEQVKELRMSLFSSNLITISSESTKITSLKQLLVRLLEFEAYYPRLRKLFQAFEAEVISIANRRESCKTLNFELRVRTLELTTVRYDWDTNLNLVDPADLKPEKCGREDREKFNGLLTAAGKPVAELKKEWAGDLKLTSRLEYALATYLLHKELRGRYTKPSLQAMTTLTTEFRRELVYYFGIDMYQLKSELK